MSNLRLHNRMSIDSEAESQPLLHFFDEGRKKKNGKSSCFVPDRLLGKKMRKVPLKTNNQFYFSALFQQITTELFHGDSQFIKFEFQAA